LTFRPAGPGVFAVEDTTVQVCWRAMPAGRWRLAVPAAGSGAREVAVDADGGPGAVVLDGLPAGERLAVEVSGPGPSRSLPFATVPAPPGDLLCRVATLSDLHVGSHRVGHLPRVVEDPSGEPSALRCARAALAEALAWGADVVVVKGDVCQESTVANWDAVGPVLAAAPVPVEVLAGNHDMGRRAKVPAGEGAARSGLSLVEGVRVRDVSGLRLVLVDTPVPGHGRGRVRHRQAAVVDALREAASDGRPALVAMHHYLQRLAVPTFWPPGIPVGQARSFLDAVAAANRSTLVTCGHTHRHRRRDHGPVVVTEVGSTKDYPGTWAGYAVHEGGIRQVVRRIADPEAIRWTERVGDTLLGAWAAWSTGRLDQRCFTHRWPA
jgi:3',5'-cyclic-AMP phosphodiesterase